MNKLLSMIMVILMAIACSKKQDDVVPAPKVLPCLITKITTSSTIATSPINKTETFEYDTDNRLIKVTVQPQGGAPTEVTSYEYDNNVIAKASLLYNTFKYQAIWTVFNGNLIKVVTTGPPAGGVVNFTYESGRLRTRSYIRDFGGQEIDIAVVYGSNGNPDSYQSSIVGFPSNTVSTYSSFDGRVNPYSLLAASMNLKNYLTYLNGDLIPEALGKNNIKESKESNYDAGSATPTSETTFLYEYEYNPKGNVASFVKSTTGYSVSVRFEYKNCN